MNLVIDIGNTRAKTAVFQDGEMLQSEVCFKEKLIPNTAKLLRNFPAIEDGILANVSAPNEGFEEALAGLTGQKIMLDATTNIPFINTYESYETLGLDRIALAAAAVSKYPQRNVLVIDAGTCVTYDIVTEDQHYLGGAISAGLNMRFRALNNFTANLPLLRAENLKRVESPGRNTTDSLHLGVVEGLAYEIDGFIARFQKDYKDLTIILTGGDYEILSKRLKNSIFAAKNFLLTGLDYILDYNKD